MPAPAETIELPLTHVRVKSHLLRRVEREWPVGTRLPPIADLARQMEAGQTSTHRAVRELVADGVLASRPGRGTFVTGPAPGSTAREGTLSGQSVRLLFNAPDPDLFTVRMLETFEQAMRGTGLSLSRGVCGKEGRARLGDEPADAVVLLNPDDNPAIRFGPRQFLTVINTALETPVVMPGRFDIVSVDQEQGGMLAGQAVHRAGCHSACFLGRSQGGGGPDRYDRTSEGRLLGFELGWGRPVPPEHRLRCRWYTKLQGAKAVEDFLRLPSRPEAVFAASDELAVGFILGAVSHGLVPGRDYQIIGFDGQQIGRELECGPLTTVDVPVRDMGRRAAELLLDRFANPDQPVRRLLLGCELFPGETCRPRPAADS